MSTNPAPASSSSSSSSSSTEIPDLFGDKAMANINAESNIRVDNFPSDVAATKAIEARDKVLNDLFSQEEIARIHKELMDNSGGSIITLEGVRYFRYEDPNKSIKLVDQLGNVTDTANWTTQQKGKLRPKIQTADLAVAYNQRVKTTFTIKYKLEDTVPQVADMMSLFMSDFENECNLFKKQNEGTVDTYKDFTVDERKILMHIAFRFVMSGPVGLGRTKWFDPEDDTVSIRSMFGKRIDKVKLEQLCFTVARYVMTNRKDLLPYSVFYRKTGTLYPYAQ
eukprot:GHVS01046630.1.p1 GENE.GHVS01046630.1~~GHVS01046630.1.p1  ORF type:complete len:280 (-),score=19.41 GHVS01046630.1:29-868(-)